MALKTPSGLFWSCGAVSEPANQEREGVWMCHMTPPTRPAHKWARPFDLSHSPAVLPVARLVYLFFTKLQRHFAYYYHNKEKETSYNTFVFHKL